MMRGICITTVLLAAIASASAQTTLRVSDQKGNSQAVMEAAGVLKDVSYRIEWKEFPAAAP
jgi:sulfonate transport system substrate-binding protein